MLFFWDFLLFFWNFLLFFCDFLLFFFDLFSVFVCVFCICFAKKARVFFPIAFFQKASEQEARARGFPMNNKKNIAPLKALLCQRPITATCCDNSVEASQAKSLIAQFECMTNTYHVNKGFQYRSSGGPRPNLCTLRGATGGCLIKKCKSWWSLELGN